MHPWMYVRGDLRSVGAHQQSANNVQILSQTYKTHSISIYTRASLVTPNDAHECLTSWAMSHDPWATNTCWLLFIKIPLIPTSHTHTHTHTPASSCLYSSVHVCRICRQTFLVSCHFCPKIWHRSSVLGWHLTRLSSTWHIVVCSRTRIVQSVLQLFFVLL